MNEMCIKNKIFSLKNENDAKNLFVIISISEENKEKQKILIELLFDKLFELDLFSVYVEYFKVYIDNFPELKTYKYFARYIYCLLNLEEFSEIENTYKKFLTNVEIRPLYGKHIYFNTALAFRRLKKYNEALLLLKKIKDKASIYKLEKGQIYMEIGLFEESEKIFKTLLKKKNTEDKAFGLFSLGELYLKKADLENLEKVYQKCELIMCKLTKENYKVTRLYLLSVFSFALNKKSKGINYLKLANNTNPVFVVDVENKRNVGKMIDNLKKGDN